LTIYQLKPAPRGRVDGDRNVIGEWEDLWDGFWKKSTIMEIGEMKKGDPLRGGRARMTRAKFSRVGTRTANRPTLLLYYGRGVSVKGKWGSGGRQGVMATLCEWAHSREDSPCPMRRLLLWSSICDIKGRKRETRTRKPPGKKEARRGGVNLINFWDALERPGRGKAAGGGNLRASP